MTNTASAAFLVIGDEILSGRTRDVNVSVLGAKLAAHGVPLVEVRIVSDDENAIVGAINDLRRDHEYVFTSGGIGPTHDDITADSIAAAFDVSIGIRPDARAMLAAHYPDPENDLNDARLRMARIPDGAELIPNSVSGAPGFRIENVYVMAGVPRIFEAMLETVLGQIEQGDVVQSASVCIDLPEGRLAVPLRALAEERPHLTFGSYPFERDGALGVEVVVRGREKRDLDEALDALAKRVNALS